MSTVKGDPRTFSLVRGWSGVEVTSSDPTFDSSQNESVEDEPIQPMKRSGGSGLISGESVFTDETPPPKIDDG